MRRSPPAELRAASWIASARKALDAATVVEFQPRVLSWFALAAEPEPTQTYRNAALLRGLIWFCTLAPAHPYQEAMTRLIDAGFAKLVPWGPAPTTSPARACTFFPGCRRRNRWPSSLASAKDA